MPDISFLTPSNPVTAIPWLQQSKSPLLGDLRQCVLVKRYQSSRHSIVKPSNAPMWSANFPILWKDIPVIHSVSCSSEKSNSNGINPGRANNWCGWCDELSVVLGDCPTQSLAIRFPCNGWFHCMEIATRSRRINCASGSPSDYRSQVETVGRWWNAKALTYLISMSGLFSFSDFPIKNSLAYIIILCMQGYFYFSSVPNLFVPDVSVSLKCLKCLIIASNMFEF